MEKVGEKGTADMLTDEQKKTNEAIWAELKKLRSFRARVRRSYDKVCDQRDGALFDLGMARSLIKSLRKRLAEAKGKPVEGEEDE